jgi:prepilin-type N-terminal cleavage/methylation domain-containing protein
MSQNNKKGFTIIEVVLVLAIAGLIFLMVFIALPALQRSQRNTQRKNDLSRFVTAATQYQSNNGNKLPSRDYEWNFTFANRYIKAGSDDQFADPDGETYVFNYYSKNLSTSPALPTCGPNSNGKNCTPDENVLDPDFGDNIKSVANTESNGTTHPITGHRILVVSNAKCSASEGLLDYSAGKNDFAMMMVLEGNSYACADNQ